MSGKRGRKCSILHCKSFQHTHKHLSFFRFPKDIERCKVWIARSGRPELLEKNAVYEDRVCEKHFTPEMFLNNHRNRLQQTAIPILHLGPSPENSPQSKRKSLLPAHHQQLMQQQQQLQLHQQRAIPNLQALMQHGLMQTAMPEFKRIKLDHSDDLLEIMKIPSGKQPTQLLALPQLPPPPIMPVKKQQVRVRNSEQLYLDAAHEVRTTGLSFRKAAQKFNINYVTLRRFCTRLNKTNQPQPPTQQQQLLQQHQHPIMNDDNNGMATITAVPPLGSNQQLPPLQLSIAAQMKFQHSEMLQQQLLQRKQQQQQQQSEQELNRKQQQKIMESMLPQNRSPEKQQQLLLQQQQLQRQILQQQQQQHHQQQQQQQQQQRQILPQNQQQSLQKQSQRNNNTQSPKISLNNSTNMAGSNISPVTQQQQLQQHQQQQQQQQQPTTTPFVPAIRRPRQIFSIEQEEELASYVRDTSNYYNGMSSKDVRTLAFVYGICNQVDLPSGWRESYQASFDWCLGFIKRNKLTPMMTTFRNPSNKTSNLTTAAVNINNMNLAAAAAIRNAKNDDDDPEEILC